MCTGSDCSNVTGKGYGGTGSLSAVIGGASVSGLILALVVITVATRTLVMHFRRRKQKDQSCTYVFPSKVFVISDLLHFPRNPLDQSQAVTELGSSDHSKVCSGLQRQLYTQSQPPPAETTTAESKNSTSGEHNLQKIGKFNYRKSRVTHISSGIFIVKSSEIP